MAVNIMTGEVINTLAGTQGENLIPGSLTVEGAVEAGSLTVNGVPVTSGNVASVSVTTANGVSGIVATPTTTPAITLTLGAITPSSVAAVGTVTGSNLSGTNTGDQTSVSGNAGTATTLQTSRDINGVAFNGSANITVTAAAGTLTGTTLNATVVSSSLTSVGTVATGVWSGTAIAETSGGTAQTTYATGDTLYASAANTISKRTIGSTGDILTVAGGVPTWATPAAGVSSVTRVARTSNTILAGSNKGNLIDITSGTFSQTFTAAATLTDGWWCYIRNSGTGEITLDPNAAELIDGLATYVMYPNECRLVTCSGTAFTSVVVTQFKATFNTSGTFVMPPGYGQLTAMVWGGGASGSKTTVADIAGGGGGGCFSSPLTTLAAGTSLTVTVGTGGAATAAAAYNNGLDSSIDNAGTILIKAYGAVDNSGGFSVSGVVAAVNTDIVMGYETAYGNAANQAAANSIWGGGTAVLSTRRGNTIYGGACGGGNTGTAAGTTVLGGAGGAGKSTGQGSGDDGTQPGGGGGTTYNGALSGAGAAGRVVIWAN